MRFHKWFPPVAALLCSSLVLAQASETSSNPKASTQGTDSKEPSKKAVKPKTSTQGTDSKEPAKPQGTPQTSFQGTDSKEPAKTTPPASPSH
jgi:hypothetical protein